MSVIYTTAAKTPRMTATKDHFVNGTLEILTAADALIVAFTLSATGGSVTGAVWTLGFVATTVAAGASGIAAKAQIKTAGGVANLTGLTVGTSGTDVVVVNTSINATQQVQVTSATITHPV
ncbi:MAG: hypothetical protein U1D06_15220 [Paracoccaceae bacterium]|nr:hypothetical protein [Paracoccaceae bacterium]